MTISLRTQFASAFAAILCAFVTVGMSIAPALDPAARLIA
jgi:hypothetical protein